MDSKNTTWQEKTFKNDDLETSVRVYYTLTADKDLQVHRTVKAFGLLIQLLEAKGVIGEKDIDKLLIECT